MCPERPSHNTEVTEKTLVLCRMTLRGWRTESHAGASTIRRVSRADSVAAAFRDTQAIAPDAAIGILLYGYHDWPDRPLEPVNVASLRVACSNHGWGMLRVPLTAGEACIVFPSAGHKSAALAWVWHNLLGRIVFADTPFSLTGTPPQE